ncbi:MAG: DNA repair protein RecO [Candidatus Cloacimonetes bacterium]|nr:DNA repair protein RecO [Candidatus Cloacimonadota bacterium]
MKKKIKTLGILYRISKYGDTSLILKTFTRDEGLISILAKGARSSSTQTAFQTLGIYELVLYKPLETGLYLLSESTLLLVYDFSQNTGLWCLAQCGCELISQILISGDEYLQYYDLQKLYLDYLNEHHEAGIYIFWRFWLRVMELLGLSYDLSNCHRCSKPLGNAAFVEKGTGALICIECAQQSHYPEHVSALSVRSIKIISKLPVIGNYVQSLSIDFTSIVQINQIIRDFFETHLHKPLHLKSLIIYEQLFSNGT